MGEGVATGGAAGCDCDDSAQQKKIVDSHVHFTPGTLITLSQASAAALEGSALKLLHNLQHDIRQELRS